MASNLRKNQLVENKLKYISKGQGILIQGLTNHWNPEGCQEKPNQHLLKPWFQSPELFEKT